MTEVKSKTTISWHTKAWSSDFRLHEAVLQHNCASLSALPCLLPHRDGWAERPQSLTVRVLGTRAPRTTQVWAGRVHSTQIVLSSRFYTIHSWLKPPRMEPRTRPAARVIRGFSTMWRLGAPTRVVQWPTVFTPWSFLEKFRHPALDHQEEPLPPRECEGSLLGHRREQQCPCHVGWLIDVLVRYGQFSDFELCSLSESWPDTQASGCIWFSWWFSILKPQQAGWKWERWRLLWNLWLVFSIYILKALKYFEQQHLG